MNHFRTTLEDIVGMLKRKPRPDEIAYCSECGMTPDRFMGGIVHFPPCQGDAPIKYVRKPS